MWEISGGKDLIGSWKNYGMTDGISEGPTQHESRRWRGEKSNAAREKWISRWKTEGESWDGVKSGCKETKQLKQLYRHHSSHFQAWAWQWVKLEGEIIRWGTYQTWPLITAMYHIANITSKRIKQLVGERGTACGRNLDWYHNRYEVMLPEFILNDKPNEMKMILMLMHLSSLISVYLLYEKV